MSYQTELVITSDASGQLWNCCVWDPRAGTSLMLYKGGGVSAAHSLCLLGNDYLVSAEATKPILNVWPVNSQETVRQGLRTVCPGRVSTLATSPDARHLVAGIEEKVHVWQVASGRLLSVASRHFQRITRLCFTDDSSHFVSGGEDGMVMVWCLSEPEEPRRIFSDHSLPVRDLVVGQGGLHSRLVTVSSDRTCKVYDLAGGTLLLSIVFPQPLTAVTLHPTELDVFVGCNDGNIHKFSLREPPRSREQHVDVSQLATYTGHTKAVTCLCVSRDGITLVSGSNDERVLVWHVASQQQTRMLPHKGPITNAFFFFSPKQMFADELKPTVLLHNLQRGMSHEGSDNIIEVLTTKELNIDDFQKPVHATSTEAFSTNSLDAKVKEKIHVLEKTNHDLYRFAVEKMLQMTNTESERIDIEDNGPTVTINEENVNPPASRPKQTNGYSNKTSKPKKKKKKHVKLPTRLQKLKLTVLKTKLKKNKLK